MQQHVAVHHDGDRSAARTARRAASSGEARRRRSVGASRSVRGPRCVASARPGRRRPTCRTRRTSKPRPPTPRRPGPRPARRSRHPSSLLARSAAAPSTVPSMPATGRRRRVGSPAAGTTGSRHVGRRREVTAMLGTRRGLRVLGPADLPRSHATARHATRSPTSSSTTGSGSPGWSRAGSAVRSGATTRATGWSRSATPRPTSPRSSATPGRARRRTPPGPCTRAASAARSWASTSEVMALWRLLEPDWGPARSIRPRQPFLVLDQRAGGRRRRPTYAGCGPTSSTCSTRPAWRCTPRSSASRPRPAAAPRSTGPGSPS